MAEPRMPATLPSPVDRTEFRFVAVEATGAAWEWIDHDGMAEGAIPAGGARDGCVTVHRREQR